MNVSGKGERQFASSVSRRRTERPTLCAHLSFLKEESFNIVSAVYSLYLPLRKDKYEKNLLWYYVDISYTGTRTEEDKETMRRETDLGEGATTKVPLGLARGETRRGGAAPPSDTSEDDEDISDDDAADDDDDGDGASSSKDGQDSGNSEDESPKPKKSRGKPKAKGRKSKRKRDELEEETPDEAL